ncbi:hypothetical protein LUZ60_007080 [Juncus effusus]|nr:hypothetical protein LUZ60_007080 [Juncus effusus]
MINPKKFMEKTKKLERKVSFGRKGHVVVYTIDGERFMVPLDYLNSKIFGELFRLSEEEYGLPIEGPIVLPCDSSFMNCALHLIRSKVSENLENKLLDFIISQGCNRCTLDHVQVVEQLAIC